MEDEKYKIQKIKIANLSLDLKNYRFNPQNSQREAIKEMLMEEKSSIVWPKTSLTKDSILRRC